MGLITLSLTLALSILAVAVAVAAGEGDSMYGSSGAQPSGPYSEKPDSPVAEVLPIGVRGVIMCKFGPNYVPLQGARARITCVGMNERRGHEKAPFSISSCQTDANGYFFASLTSQFILKHKINIGRCKVFIEESPSSDCQVKTDVNRGKSGAYLSSYKKLEHNNIDLYTVGPFFYTSYPNDDVTTGY